MALRISQINAASKPKVLPPQEEALTPDEQEVVDSPAEDAAEPDMPEATDVKPAGEGSGIVGMIQKTVNLLEQAAAMCQTCMDKSQPMSPKSHQQMMEFIEDALDTLTGTEHGPSSEPASEPAEEA